MLRTGDVAGFTQAAAAAFISLRAELETHLVTLANLIAPLRRKKWRWQKRSDSEIYGELTPVADAEHLPKIRWQRGLSMMRLEQLEGLRRLFLRYNRSLDRTPGTPAVFGSADRGRVSGEPCRHLLGKIDQMKEERVNQTAHLILAQALGLRLRPRDQAAPAADRQRADIHGEYEKIPDRVPVDFIVIEDLSRYRSSQGRAPWENSRLMKWCHRAVRDKIKMLAQEPFGIPVVEVIPAYSSRFHSCNGQPGARLHELHTLENFRRRSLEKSKDVRAPQLLEQFAELEKLNAERKNAGTNKPPFTLFYPQDGGPLFLAVRDGNPMQADTNAAANLGFRAIAAPECLNIHRRIRSKKHGGKFLARTENAREKAAFSSNPEITVSGELSSKFRKSASPNFFYEPDDLRQEDGRPAFDRATIQDQPLVSQVSLWSLVKQAMMRRCVDLNESRLAKWRDDIPL